MSFNVELSLTEILFKQSEKYFSPNIMEEMNRDNNYSLQFEQFAYQKSQLKQPQLQSANVFNDDTSGRPKTRRYLTSNC